MLNSPDKNIIISKPDKIEKETYVQSANVLFNFMQDLEYLKKILRNKAIIPRYVEEKIDYLNIEEAELVFPMTCFCDISLNKLIPHLEFYGFYGIGLDKGWGIDFGIQPIHYINPKSYLYSDYKTAFKLAKDLITETEANTSISDYLISALVFTKPLRGKMLKRGVIKEKIFHDEKEWRYIPKFGENHDIPFFVPREHQNGTAYNSYSLALVGIPEIWLKFEPEQIKYLAVKDEEDRMELIDFIMNEELSFSKSEKYILISKILVFDILKEDW